MGTLCGWYDFIFLEGSSDRRGQIILTISFQLPSEVFSESGLMFRSLQLGKVPALL